MIKAGNKIMFKTVHGWFINNAAGKFMLYVTDYNNFFNQFDPKGSNSMNYIYGFNLMLIILASARL